ncbi:UV DNA damage repair endonuclease UvsE [uncultured Methanoregula sp.]|uniref:UV DNA damage repair endonuclease UvsE n=1 Tax=uncultured Methanoregula sp. TaxID=1005933 RepID=UPI002AAB49E1|nr:UV DNA damage repair endonuclease UvsE [uncultured Methanoregula sp.]
MRIGYPCINRSIGCTPSSTFRLASYSPERLKATVEKNLTCLRNILRFNREAGLLFFRISSDMVPFASHPVCTFPWQERFGKTLSEIGLFIRKNRFRISMHPDQFVLLNSPREDVIERSIDELRYHAEFLDLMGLDTTAKIQLHVGGIYNDKSASLERFVTRYDLLDDSIRRRLVIENDEKLYSVTDCLGLYERTGIAVLLDTFHHSLNNTGEHIPDLLAPVRKSWKEKDGIPMVDYSSQQAGKRAGAHAGHINKEDFLSFLAETGTADFDVMLEIKDKEASAKTALVLARDDPRLVVRPGDPG